MLGNYCRRRVADKIQEIASLFSFLRPRMFKALCVEEGIVFRCWLMKPLKKIKLSLFISSRWATKKVIFYFRGHLDAEVE